MCIRDRSRSAPGGRLQAGILTVSVNDPRATVERTGALCVRPLDVQTWPATARLVEANNGVWGGCWRMGFHVKVGKGRTPAQNRTEKEQRVREGCTHAALVIGGDQRLGWCQFGSPGELPEIKCRCRYEKGSPPSLTSILGTGCSSSWVEVQRGGNPKRRLRPPHQGMGMSSSGKPASMSTGAVSYTHLRAHETVLDLVCRLLLEKK